MRLDIRWIHKLPEVGTLAADAERIEREERRLRDALANLEDDKRIVIANARRRWNRAEIARAKARADEVTDEDRIEARARGIERQCRTWDALEAAAGIDDHSGFWCSGGTLTPRGCKTEDEARAEVRRLIRARVARGEL